ncbi:pilus assembly protein N-terminal domain-containing protein [Maricaulaceae bacterium MS644]
MIIRSLAAALTATALSGACASAALADRHTVRIPSNHAGVVRLPEAAATVIVGNPAIADAALYDQRTLLVSGRAFGQTNVIAMNQAGQVIYTADLSITESNRNHVRVYRNNVQYSFVCDPECQTAPTVGDQVDWFDDMSGQRATQAGQAAGAAEAASEGG